MNKTNEFEKVEREVHIDGAQGQNWENLEEVPRYFFYHNPPMRTIRTFKYNSNTDFVYSVQYSRPRALIGNQKFWEQTDFTYLKVHGSHITGDKKLVAQVLRKLNLEWAVEDYIIEYLCWKSNKVLLTVLKGKVTNPHQAYQYANRVLYKGAFTPKLLSKALRERFTNWSLWDLIWYTTNPHHSLMVLLREDPRKPEGYKKLFEDTLFYARMHGEKINPKWDLETLHRRHQAQIEEEKRLECSTKDSTNIYDGVNTKLPPFQGFSITPLSTEVQCYLNAVDMHNCTHGVYWERAKRGRYIILKGDNGSDPFNLGIRVNVLTETLEYDQASYRHNAEIPRSMVYDLHEYVNNNYELLKEMALSAATKK